MTTMKKKQEEFERSGERPAASAMRCVKTNQTNGKDEDKSSSSSSLVQSHVERDVVTLGPLPSRPPFVSPPPTLPHSVQKQQKTESSTQKNEGDSQQRFERSFIISYIMKERMSE
jgi:hypothetical protein